MTQSIIYDASPPSTDGRFWAKRITKKMKLMSTASFALSRLMFGNVATVPTQECLHRHNWRNACESFMNFAKARCPP